MADSGLYTSGPRDNGINWLISKEEKEGLMIKYTDGKPKHVQHGVLAKECCGLTLELMPLKSANGWYLGTADEGGPVSRESIEYWGSESVAQTALDTNEWVQKDTP
jgi:hypothetical protein